jgi:hypothetical protein
MARYSATWESVTCVAYSDGTIHTTGTNYPGSLRGGTASQQCKVNEVYIGGESGASNPTSMVLARTNPISAGALSVGNNVLMDVTATAPSTAASWGSTAATTYPTRTAANYLLGLSLNTYGGIARWQARYGEEISIYGNATNSSSEVVLSSRVGTGLTSGHIIYEVV